MPASSSSTTSCQRLAWREPGALVCASSSTRISAGRRASAASRSNSASVRAAVLDRPARQDLEAAQQRLGLGAPVRLDAADDDVDALGALLAGRLEHGVGLADAGGGAEEDLELAACLAGFLLLDAGEQLVGIRARSVLINRPGASLRRKNRADSTTRPVDTGRTSRRRQNRRRAGDRRFPLSCGNRLASPPLDVFLMRGAQS